MRKHKRKGGFLMTMGLLLIAAALLLTLQNIREQRQADADAAAALSLMKTVMPQETDAPQTLVLTDEQGNPLDWPLDAQGEPIPWPVEDGVPAASVTDGEGRTVYWAQLRGEDWPAQAEATESQSPADALPDDGAAGTDEGQAASLLTDGTQTEQIPAEQDALPDWTVDKQGALLPWIRDAAGRLTPWPTDGTGQVMSWSQLRQNWQSLLDALSPLLTLAASQPSFVRYPDMEMPTREIEGRTYIGMLEVPALELSLPVMSEWSYPRLKKAPCRYVGSIYSKDMIICGHNYDRHFGRLKDLAVGEEVRFTDMDGNVFIYSISGTEQLGKFAVEEMLAGDWDLTLFTCTKGGQSRVTVRCRLERYIVGENQDEAQQAE